MKPDILQKAHALNIPINATSTFEHCTQLALRFSTNDRIIETIMVLAIMYNKFNKVEDTLKLTASIFKFGGQWGNKNRTQPDMEDSAWGSTTQRGWASFYEETIEACIRFPFSKTPTIFLTMSELPHVNQEKFPEQVNILKRLVFFTKEPTPYFDMFLFQSLDRIPSALKRRDTDYVQVIEILLKKLIALEKGKDFLLALWVYSLYTGDIVVRELVSKYLAILEVDLEKEYQRFNEKPYWPWYQTEDLIKRHSSVVEKLAGTLKNPDSFSSRLSAASLNSLIPSILYAKHKNNIEAASFFLWYAAKQPRFPKLFERLEEMTGGFAISNEFKNLHAHSRKAWLSVRMEKVSGGAAQKGSLPKQLLKYLKEIYALNPFNISVVECLIRANSETQAAEFRKMYEYSISKISSSTNLQTLLVKNILHTGNDHATSTILKRLDALGMHATILHVAEQITQKTPSNRRVLHSLNRMLKFYEQSLLSDDMSGHTSEDIVRYQRIKKGFEQFHQQAKVVFSNDETSAMKENHRILTLLRRGDLASLLAIANGNQSLSVQTLEVILQAALAHGTSKQVYDLYQRLAEKDRGRAVSYNSDVEMHILLLNRGKRESSKNQGLASNIWGVAVHLENPIDSKASRVA
jgi:hypothetical protein